MSQIDLDWTAHPVEVNLSDELFWRCFMAAPRFSAKAISVALLILCMAVAASAQGIAALKARADSGEANAQYNLGLLYDLGQGLPQDYAQAAV